MLIHLQSRTVNGATSTTIETTAPTSPTVLTTALFGTQTTPAVTDQQNDDEGSVAIFQSAPLVESVATVSSVPTTLHEPDRSANRIVQPMSSQAMVVCFLFNPGLFLGLPVP